MTTRTEPRLPVRRLAIVLLPLAPWVQEVGTSIIIVLLNAAAGAYSQRGQTDLRNAPLSNHRGERLHEICYT